MKFIIGKKLNMTQIWQGDKVVGVTKVQVGPCTVTQVKTDDKDGYSAVQLGYGERKEKNIKKPQKGHLKNLGNFKYLREFRIENEEVKKGDVIEISTFEVGDKVEATSTSKGKGFQGVVKRHGFRGTKKTHGNKDQERTPGSIGATGPAHVFKGMRMPGRMGGDQVITKNLEIIEIDLENNVLFVKGAIAGARNSLVLVSGDGELKIIKNEKLKINNVDKEVKSEEKVEDGKEEEAMEEKKEDKKPTDVEASGEVKGEK